MVVCNTTPLSNLLHLGQTLLLGKLFGRVVAPQAVREEIEAYFAADAGWKRCIREEEVVVEPATDRLLVRQFGSG